MSLVVTSFCGSTKASPRDFLTCHNGVIANCASLARGTSMRGVEAPSFDATSLPPLAPSDTQPASENVPAAAPITVMFFGMFGPGTNPAMPSFQTGLAPLCDVSATAGFHPPETASTSASSVSSPEGLETMILLRPYPPDR